MILSMAQLLKIITPSLLVLFSALGCSHLKKLEFNDFFSAEIVTARDYESSNEVAQLLKIQRNLDQRNFREALAQSQLFQRQYPYSIYDLWVKVMEGLSFEGLEDYEKALSRLQVVIQSTAGERARSMAQIQTFALFHRGRIQIKKGEEQRGLASFLDAFQKKELLPKVIWQVELPLEIARTYSLLQNEKESAEYEKLSAKGFEAFLREEALSSQQKASIFLRLGWRERPRESSFQEFGFMQADQQKNLYLLAAIQTEVEPYSRLALANLMTVLGNWQRPFEQKEPKDIEARAEFRQQRKRYAQMLAEVYREIEIHLTPLSLRGPKEIEFAQFFESSKTALMAVFKEQFLTNELTLESAKRNAIRREFLSPKFMPRVKSLPEMSPNPELPPSVDPNL